MHTTAGSFTLDLATDRHLTLSPQTQCYKITTGVYGPLPSGTVEIILGRNGLTSQGFIVHPRIIDEDLKGEIKIMAYAKRRVIGSVQLLLFSYITGKAPPVERTGGFGSPGKYMVWQTVANDLRPKLKLQINGIEIEAEGNWVIENTAGLNQPIYYKDEC